MMQTNVDQTCDTHPDPFDCPDHLVYYDDRFDTYGIIVHDGGHSSVVMAFCPWCGTKLPNSKEEQWFAELEKLGFDDPHETDIPDKYKTDEWYNTTDQE